MANEKRLIDANALLEIYKKWIPQLSSKEDEGDRRGVETCITVLEDAPTIAAVEIVRCRDCKHLNVLNRKELYAHCPKTNTVFLPFDLDTREHFCSLGERKDGGE